MPFLRFTLLFLRRVLRFPPDRDQPEAFCMRPLIIFICKKLFYALASLTVTFSAGVSPAGSAAAGAAGADAATGADADAPL